MVAFALTAIAVLGLELALLRSDLWLRYVAEHTARNLPAGYRMAALVTGPAGALLVLALMASGSATAAIVAGRSVRIADRPWALATLAAAVVVLLVASALAVPPFERLAWLPLEGSGMLPRLQTPTAVLRPLVGLAAHAMLVVPAALALDALVRRSTGLEWWSFMTRWLLAAWVVQSVALALGLCAALREPSWPQSWGRESLLWGLLPTWLLTAACLAVTRRRRPRGSRLAVWILAAGALAIAVGLVGGRSARTYTVTLGQGESTALRDAFDWEWTFAQQGVSAFRAGNWEVTAITLEGVSEGGRRVLLVTERRQSVDSRDEEILQPVVTMAVASSPLQDIAVTLERTLPRDAAELRIEFRPFQFWIWVGCALVITAGLVAWVGSPRRVA